MRDEDEILALFHALSFAKATNTIPIVPGSILLGERHFTTPGKNRT
jgi:hypothetical protein